MTDTNGGTPGGEGLFKKPAPEGAAKRMSEVLGEVVWLMSQSPLHKQFFIQDLEWFGASLPAGSPQGSRKRPPETTPVLLQQFRLYYADDRPLGVVFWATVSDEVEKQLAQGTSKLRPQDWKSGDRLWVVEAIAPFGGAEEMVKDLKAKVFPGREVRYLAVGADGRREVRSV